MAKTHISFGFRAKVNQKFARISTYLVELIIISLLGGSFDNGIKVSQRRMSVKSYFEEAQLGKTLVDYLVVIVGAFLSFVYNFLTSWLAWSSLNFFVV